MVAGPMTGKPFVRVRQSLHARRNDKRFREASAGSNGTQSVSHSEEGGGGGRKREGEIEREKVHINSPEHCPQYYHSSHARLNRQSG